MPTNVLIAFDPRTGTIESLAKAAAEGAEAAGAEARRAAPGNSCPRR